MIELNKIYCGDCLEVMRQIPDHSVDMVLTDPPYSSGGQFKGDRAKTTIEKYVQTESERTCRTEFTGDNRDQRSFLIWCNLWMSEARRISKTGGVIACFTDWRQLPTVTDAVQCAGWIWRGIGTWWKPGIRMQKGRFSASAEYVVYATNGAPAEGETSPQNVFSFAPVGGAEKEHIAEKPIEVILWALGLCIKKGIVLDPFLGSGTTAVACKRTDRNFIGIEISPEYCEIARKRLEKTYYNEELFSEAESC